MDREARVSVGPRRNHDGGHQDRFPESDWTVVGITAAYLLTAPSQQLADKPAPPPPNEAGGCWKELPETLAKKKAIWNPQNEDHRCFMWCVLAHCLGVEGLNKHQRSKATSCSGSFFYPELAGRRGPRPPGWQPALADAGVDFSGLPTDRPVNFDDIEAFELRNAGRVEVFVFVWQQTLWADGLEYYHVLQQRAPSGTGVVQHTVLLLLHSGHYSLIHNFQALAGRQGLTRSHAHQHRRLRGVQVPEVHGPLCQEGLLAAPPRHPVLSRDGRAHSESAAARAREEPAALPGKASAELAPLTCYADLEVYSTPAPTVHVAQQQPARQTVAASSCYVAVGRCGYVPPEELRLRLTHHERDSDKYHAVRAMLDDLLKLADHYLTWRRRTRPVSMTRREELEHRAATHCREWRPSRPPRRSSTTATAPGSISGRCATPATSRTPNKTIPVVFHNGSGYDFHFLLRYIASRQPGAARRARRGQRRRAWNCILRKLPMPFKHFCGAEAWEMPAVWEQHCYDSVLAGKAVSAEDYRLAANVMGWETFREFHDCYLYTDVLALADVMESYRDSFRAQSGLDPIHYVTLPGAAWDAMTSRPTGTCGPPSWAG